MKNIIFNEDCNHFIFTREHAGKPVTKQDAIDFIMQYKDLGIREMMFDLGAPLPWYDAKGVRNVRETYPEYIARGGKPIAYVQGLIDFHNREGVDVQSIFFQAAREAGLSPYISFRMCDVHEGYCKDSFLWSYFYRDKRKTMHVVPHRTPAAYLEYCLNYHFEEVREHMLFMLRDALDSFDADGLELDFLREAYLLGFGKEHEGTKILNEHMRSIHALVKQAEKKWGHPMQISVRLPATPEKALSLGFDFFDWIDAKLIDRIVISSRWASTDTEMPVALWHKILKGKNVRLAAGLEVLMRAYPEATPQGHSYETAVGTATAFLAQGADEIYLFNFFDFYENFSNVPYFGSDQTLYHRFLTIAGDYETLINEPRRHVVTYNDMPAPGMEIRGQLPLLFRCDRNASTPFDSNILYKRVRVVTGKIPAHRQVRVVLGLEKNAALDASDLIVYLNQTPCRAVGTQDAKAPQPSTLDYLVFEAENKGDFGDVCTIEIGLAHGEATVAWAEIEVTDRP